MIAQLPVIKLINFVSSAPDEPKLYGKGVSAEWHLLKLFRMTG